MSETAAADRDRSDRILVWSLRLFGGVDLLAMVAYLMPELWIRHVHVWMGFGEFPEGPVPEYLARATSLLWAMHGALLICLATDVRRYADVIRCVALLTIVSGCFLFILGLRTDLPAWWTLLEGPVFAATGLWYLWLLRGGREG